MQNKTWQNILSGTLLLMLCQCRDDVRAYQGIGMENTIKKGDEYKLAAKEDIARNDIVLFRIHQLDSIHQTMARVVAIPGDTIQILNGRIFVNHNLFLLPGTALFHYKVKFRYIDDEIRADLRARYVDGYGNYDCFLSNDEQESLTKYKNAIIDVTRGYDTAINQQMLLQQKNNFGWTEDNFGPIVIPRQGSYFRKDSANIFLNTEGEFPDTSILINKNYYFLIGDNFNNCLDSRHLGLIGENLIVGKVKIK